MKWIFIDKILFYTENHIFLTKKSPVINAPVYLKKKKKSMPPGVYYEQNSNNNKIILSYFLTVDSWREEQEKEEN